MKKRIQVLLNDDSWPIVEEITKSANQGFENGNINYSDVINEMVLSSNVDIDKLQLKHTNLRKSLRLLASKKDLDVDLAIESLLALKKGVKAKSKKTKTQIEDEQCLSS
ncbi:MAG: hypothetical protein KDD50_12355 [Bdellovibrionales bacterium]|nr:hypothetical protein [Bdellovibrionales bacterium]